MLLVIGEPTVFEIVQIIITSLVGIFSISAGMVGYMQHKVPVWQRLLLVGGGLLLVSPDTVTDIIGFAIVAAMVVVQYVLTRKKAEINA